MRFQLVRPVKRSDSSYPQFTQRIPADVRPLAIGRVLVVPLGSETVRITITPTMGSIRFSLRTLDPSEAKARQGQAAATLETFWATLRKCRPVTLDHKQATALAGELYRAWTADRVRTTSVTLMPDGGWQRDSETPDEELGALEPILVRLDAASESIEPTELEHDLGPLVDRLLLRRGIASVDDDTRPILLKACAQGLRDAFLNRKRNLEGDYSTDPRAARFPDFEPPEAKAQPKTPSPSSPKTSLTGLLAAWWAERKAAGLKPSTYESYRHTMAAFVAFLKHDEVARVTADDVLGFKNHRLASINPRTGKTISAKTVRDSDLAGLRAIFEWAVANRRMASNPAKEVRLRLGKARKVRSKGFTDAEAKALLEAAWRYKAGARETPRVAAAKRWVPWLSAYTGARVGELAQLRREDLRREGEHWLINITPEAGTVKTNEAREVVLHAHLIELGFPEFVAKAPSGHLFVKPAKSGDVLGPLQAVKNRLGEFARETVTDPNVAPNHGWRHRFKTVGIEAGMGERVVDAIQGHAPRTAGDSYGEVTVKAMALGMAKFPRTKIA